MRIKVRQDVILVTAEGTAGDHIQGMEQLADMTVGEVAARWPAAARVLEEHGIHFCCDGQISIADACLARGIEPDVVVREVERRADSGETDTTDWLSAPAGDLVDHIVGRHHAYLRTQLPRIQSLFEGLIHASGQRRGDILHSLFTCFREMREVLDARLMQQETVLFPLLRNVNRASGTLLFHRSSEPDPIQLMMEGHEATAKALAEMRRITSNYQAPADARVGQQELYELLRNLEADLHRHFHLENNILFRKSAGLARRKAGEGG